MESPSLAAKFPMMRRASEKHCVALIIEKEAENSEGGE